MENTGLNVVCLHHNSNIRRVSVAGYSRRLSLCLPNVTWRSLPSSEVGHWNTTHKGWKGSRKLLLLLITNFYGNSRNSTGKLWELIKAFGKVVRYWSICRNQQCSSTALPTDWQCEFKKDNIYLLSQTVRLSGIQPQNIWHCHGE